MRKLFGIMIMISMLLLVVACGNESAEQKFAEKLSQEQDTVVNVAEVPSEAPPQAPEPEVHFCGDGKCEGNEPEEGCEDCPSCNDFNRCTRDYFDLSETRCKHTIIIPCCGDGECETSEQDMCIADCGSDMLLDDFPEPFIQDGDWNMFLIIGKEGTSSDVVAATSIIEGLVFSDVAQGYSKYAKLDNEIGSIEGKNAILIGNPCTNLFIEQLMPFSGSKCLEEFSEGEGLIKLFKTGSDSYALVVAGNSDDDVRRAAQILGNYLSAGLKGYQRKV